MKIIFLILSLQLIVQFCSGQGKKINIPISQNGDTTGEYLWQQRIIKKTGLKDLVHSNDLLHLRFSSDHQIIDIWTNNFRTFYGTLTNFISGDIIGQAKAKCAKFFKEIEKIDTCKVREIYKFFLKDSILLIPTQDSIKGWGTGLDGITYFIEESTPNAYSFKEYWTPFEYKDRVPDAKKLMI